LRGVPSIARYIKIHQALRGHDVWHIWHHLARTVFAPVVPSSFVLQRYLPFSVKLTTQLMQPLILEVTSFHTMDFVMPFNLYGSIQLLLQPSVESTVEYIRNTINALSGTCNPAVQLYWETSPITLYEFDLTYGKVYEYPDVVMTYQNGRFQYRTGDKRRVCSRAVRCHIGMLAEYNFFKSV
jgi:hypothetical protein